MPVEAVAPLKMLIEDVVSPLNFFRPSVMAKVFLGERASNKS
jgi:hypothetical protein